MRRRPWIAALLVAVGVVVVSLITSGHGHGVLWRAVLVVLVVTVVLRIVGFLLGAIWRGALGVHRLHPTSQSGTQWLRSRRGLRSPTRP
jgi:hypothetical protein